MSVFTKIFIVINLALTLGLTGVAGSLFAQRSNSHFFRYKSAAESLGKYTADLKAERGSHTEFMSAMTDKIANEGQALDRARTEAGTLSQQISKAAKDIADGEKSRNEHYTLISKLEKQSNELNDEVKILTTQRNTAEATRNEALAKRNRSHNNLRETEDDVAATEQSIANVIETQKAQADRIKIVEGLLQDAKRRGVPVEEIARKVNQLGPKLQGVISRIEAQVYLCFIDLGENDGVQEGMLFTVSRGDQYICKIEVKSVSADNASAWILTETMVQGRSPSTGDTVKNLE